MISVLGPLEIRLPDADLTLPGALPARVLVLLTAQAGRPVPVDVIADQLWDGQPPRTARKSIQVIVHRLRRLPGVRERLVRSERGYLLRLTERDCDARRFEATVTDATHRYERGDLAGAAPLLARALALWRGPAFTGFDDMPLVRDEGIRLSDLRLAALETHADIGLRLGHHHRLVAELPGPVAAHPFRERLRGQLMLALYRAGRPAEALAEYRTARALFIEELGVEPGVALQNLHRRILNRDLRLLGPLPTPLRSEPSFLPREASGFTGRTRELEWLDHRAAEESSTAVISSLSGIGGIGKTALMLHWAHRRADRFPDGQFFVELGGAGGLATAKGALHHLLTCLGVPRSELPATLADSAALYRALLADRRALVLIDNAQTADQVRPLLPGAPGCFVVVTSRTGLAGLVARDGAQQIVLRPLSDPEATTLLRRLLGPDRVAAEPDAVAALVALCGGIPLALRIAAAHLCERAEQRIEDYVAELSRRDPVGALAVDGDEHHGVRAVFDASYALLTPEQRAAFAASSAIPGLDFSSETLAAVAAITREQADAILAELVVAGFVEESRPGRYLRHDLIRAYSGEALRSSGTPPTEPLDRLLHHYRRRTTAALELVRPAIRTDSGGDDPVPADAGSSPADTAAAAAWLATEYHNLAAAVTAAATAGMTDHVRGLVEPMWHVCHHHGQVTLWISTFEAVVQAIQEQSAEDAIYPVLNALGNAYVMAGDYDAAIEVHSRCVRAWEAAGAAVDAARARTNLAGSLERLARYPEALTNLDLALRTFRTADLPAHQAYVLCAMGHIHQRLRDFTTAHRCLTEALALVEPTRSHTDLARTLNMLAHVCLDLGRLTDAQRHAEAAAEVAREGGNAHIATMVKTTQASILRAAGRYAESLALSQEAHERIRAMGMPGNECESHLEMGLTYQLAGQPDRALAAYREARRLAEELGELHLRVRGLLGVGSCLRDTDPAAAAAAYREALEIMADLELPEAEDARRALATLPAAPAPPARRPAAAP